jgi:hypothetical protein
MLVLPLHMTLVPITTTVVSSHHAHGEVSSLQHYVIKFVKITQIAKNANIY